MPKYEIGSRESAASLGVFEAATEEDALLAMTIEAGYASIEDAADRLDETPEEYRAAFVIDRV